MIRWNGKRHEFSDWNRDQTLESAFRGFMRLVLSGACPPDRSGEVPRLAEAFGLREAAQPFETTTFWLDGSLEISASEQADFLRKVYLRKLPFSDSSYTTLRRSWLPKETPIFRYTAKPDGRRLRSRRSAGMSVIWKRTMMSGFRSEHGYPQRNRPAAPQAAGAGGTCCERHNQAGWDNKTGKIEGCLTMLSGWLFV